MHKKPKKTRCNTKVQVIWCVYSYMYYLLICIMLIIWIFCCIISRIYVRRLNKNMEIYQIYTRSQARRPFSEWEGGAHEWRRVFWNHGRIFSIFFCRRYKNLYYICPQRDIIKWQEGLRLTQLNPIPHPLLPSWLQVCGHGEKLKFTSNLGFIWLWRNENNMYRYLQNERALWEPGKSYHVETMDMWT
jgi:hypothetical protein